MPNTQDNDNTFFSKIVSLVKQFPWVAFCLWMGYRDMSREASLEAKEKEQISRDIDRETFYRSQLLYWRQKVDKELSEEQKQLNYKYELDTAK